MTSYAEQKEPEVGEELNIQERNSALGYDEVSEEFSYWKQIYARYNTNHSCLMTLKNKKAARTWSTKFPERRKMQKEWKAAEKYVCR